MSYYNKKLGISFLFFAISLFGFAQVSADKVCDEYQYEELFRKKADKILEDKETESLTYEQAFKNLQSLYEKMKNSESAAELQKRRDDFKKKLKIEFKIKEREDDLYQRITENINSTSFKNIDEAISEHRKYLEASCLHYRNNEEFWVYAYMAMYKFGIEILSKAIMDYEFKSRGFDMPIEDHDKKRDLDLKYWTPQSEENKK